LGAEFVSFGLAGTGVLLALVFALSSLLDPIDTRARKAITSWIARVPRHRINSERPVVPDA
jgi:hypothetical protein